MKAKILIFLSGTIVGAIVLALAFLVPRFVSLIEGSSGSVYTNRSGIFSMRGFKADYLQLLSESVFAGYRDFAPVSYAELPSFGPEQGFWLSPDRDGYFVLWSEATTNLWFWAGFTATPEEQPRCAGRSRKELAELAEKEGVVKFYHERISRELGDRIRSCWQRTVLEGRPLETSQGLDGVTVILGATDERSNSAFWEVWSPPMGSKAELLMRLAHSVRKLLVEKNDTDLLATLKEIEEEPNPERSDSP